MPDNPPAAAKTSLMDLRGGVSIVAFTLPAEARKGQGPNRARNRPPDPRFCHYVRTGGNMEQYHAEQGRFRVRWVWTSCQHRMQRALSTNINAREIVILGKVGTTVTASDRFDLRRDGSIVGDIVAPVSA